MVRHWEPLLPPSGRHAVSHLHFSLHITRFSCLLNLLASLHFQCRDPSLKYYHSLPRKLKWPPHCSPPGHSCPFLILCSPQPVICFKKMENVFGGFPLLLGETSNFKHGVKLDDYSPPVCAHHCSVLLCQRITQPCPLLLPGMAEVWLMKSERNVSTYVKNQWVIYHCSFSSTMTMAKFRTGTILLASVQSEDDMEHSLMATQHEREINLDAGH